MCVISPVHEFGGQLLGIESTVAPSTIEQCVCHWSSRISGPKGGPQMGFAAEAITAGDQPPELTAKAVAAEKPIEAMSEVTK